MLVLDVREAGTGARTLEVDAGFGDVSCETLEFSPGHGLVCLLFGVRFADGQAVGAGPWAGVFYVIVSGHVFGDDRDIMALIAGEQQCGCESTHAGPAMDQLMEIQWQRSGSLPKDDDV